MIPERFKRPVLLAYHRRYAEALAEYNVYLGLDPGNVAVVTPELGVVPATDLLFAWSNRAGLMNMLGRGREATLQQWLLTRQVFAKAGRRLWEGQPLDDHERLFVRCGEKPGLGDAILQARYVPEMRRRARNLTLMGLPQPLCKLFAEQFDVTGTPKSLDPGDRFFCGYSWGANPVSVDPAWQPTFPYLKADLEKAAGWRARFRSECDLAVGLNWTGSKEAHETGRTCDPNHSPKPLTTVPRHIKFYGVNPAAKPTFLPEGLNFSNAPAESVRTWQDTLAVLDALDLLVSTDTSLVHAVGALGRPCWMLLPYHLAEMWGPIVARRTSLYPSITVFQQRTPGEWRPLFEEIAKLLTNGPPL